MKNRRIEVSYGLTVNMGNYESKRIDVTLGEDIEDSDDVSKSISEVFEFLNGKVISLTE